MGKVSISKERELINTDGEIMQGVYGTGEVTGGFHGGNRLSDNSLMECVILGRRVAKAALSYISKIETIK